MEAGERKAEARAAGSLVPAMAEALDEIAHKGAEAWIRHCGYGVQ